jgi:hypothetical protein
MVNKRGPMKDAKKLSLRERKLLKALPSSKTVGEAAVKAGYSKKNPRQSGHQAMRAMRGRVPDLMDELGLSERFIIDKHLRPMLSATDTKFVREVVEVKRGRKLVQLPVVKQYVVADNMARLNAIDKTLLLHGSYAPRDPKEAAQFGVKVIIQNIRGIPRPPIDIRPGDPIPPLPEESKNGHKNGDGK